MIVKFQVVIFINLLNQVSPIIYGEIANANEWPSVVLIAYRTDQTCTGTLIMSNWVISAARCIDPKYIGGDTLIGVRIGVTNLDIHEGKIIPYASRHVHPYYLVHSSSGSTVNDVGLLKLKKYVLFTDHIHPLPLSYQLMEVNVTCATAGWGVNKLDVYTNLLKDSADLFDKPRVLQQVMQLTINMSECKRGRNPSVRDAIDEEFHICARHSYEENAPGPSYGDFGSPLVCNGEQVGILAFGILDVSLYTLHMAVYSNLERSRSWIEETIKGENEKDNARFSVPPATEMQEKSFWDDLNYGQGVRTKGCKLLVWYLSVISVLYFFYIS